MPDQAYRLFSYRFENKGLTARFPADNLPPATYANLDGLESRIENALSTRLGNRAITCDPANNVNTPLPAAIHTLARLKSLDGPQGANTYRYAAAGNALYRRQGDSQGGFEKIADGLSGQRFSTINYRPDFASIPYLFLADLGRMLKDNGDPRRTVWLDRAAWTPTVDSEFGPGYEAGKAIDGDTATLWSSAGGGAPHTYDLDLGVASVLSTLQYTPRQDDLRDGDITDYEVWVKDNALDAWSGPIVAGSWISDASVKVITFPPQTKRYVRLVSLTGDSATIGDLRLGYLTESPTQWGMHAPAIPASISLDNPDLNVMETFDELAKYTLSADFTPVTSLNVGIGTNIPAGIVELPMPGETTRGNPRYFPNKYVVHSIAYEFVERSGPWDVYRPYTADLGLRGNLAMWKACDGTGGSGSSDSLHALPGGYAPTDPRYLTDPFPLSTLGIGAGQKIHVAGANPEDVIVIATNVTTWKAAFAFPHASTDVITALGIVPRCSTQLMDPVSAPGNATVRPVSLTNIVPGMVLRMDYGQPNEETVVVNQVSVDSFTAVFTKAHAIGAAVSDLALEGTIAATKTATITRIEPLDLSATDSLTAEEDFIHLSLVFDIPERVSKIRMLFDVSDGSFTKDYFYAEATIGVPSATPAPDGTLYATKSVWTSYEVRRAKFLKNGDAGLVGKDWANVTGFQIEITVSSAGTLTVDLDDLYLSGGAGPDVFGGVAYDYVYTKWNQITNLESAPCPMLIDSAWVEPHKQPILITIPPIVDTQATHWRLYRRGGTLPTGFRKVSDVPIGTWNFLDVLSDSYMSNQKLLELDNYPPVTSPLRVPVDTKLDGNLATGQQTVQVLDITNISVNQIVTIGHGSDEEDVVVQAVDGENKTFAAYFQKAHASGSRVYATATFGKPCRLAALAFDCGWLAGDPDNPDRLYYSKKGQIESFPPQNWIPVGSPSDPIKDMVEVSGYLWVGTLSTWYRIFYPSGGSSFVNAGGVQSVVTGSVPQAIKSGLRHGPVVSFGICDVVDDILYPSFDGIYSLRGDELSKLLQWLFRNEDLGPLHPLDKNQMATLATGFHNNEIFYAYTDTHGERKRIIYSHRDQRWRNDSIAATALLYEKDTGNLIYGTADGMIYQDRVGDVDSLGYLGGAENVAPISFALETIASDQGLLKNPKQYSHVCLDMDTHGEPVHVDLLFDNGKTLYDLGDFACNGRTQIQCPVNDGEGYESLNVAMRITGAVKKRVDLFEIHLQAQVLAEKVKSFDTFWLRDSAEGWKFAKQAWIDYVAKQPLTVAFYIDGSDKAVYTFTLPASSTRNAVLSKLPDVKFKMRRLIITSSDDFSIYGPSHVAIRMLGASGYQKTPLLTEP